jgi:hypothetical protein
VSCLLRIAGFFSVAGFFSIRISVIAYKVVISINNVILPKGKFGCERSIAQLLGVGLQADDLC